MCYKELDKRFAVVHGKKVTKKDRIKATIQNSLTQMTKTGICSIQPDVNTTIVEAVLGDVVRTGSVRKVEQRRGTGYMCNPK